MPQKAAAGGIVGAIGVIATAVLYSPVTTIAPAPAPPALGMPAPLQPAAPQPVALPRVIPLRASGRPIVTGRPLVGLFTGPQGVSGRRPATAPLPEPVHSPVAAMPLIAAAPLPGAAGHIPDRARSGQRRRGAMRTAGESVGAAFTITGRGLRAAFKRAF